MWCWAVCRRLTVETKGCAWQAVATQVAKCSIAVCRSNPQAFQNLVKRFLVSHVSFDSQWYS